MKIALMTDIRKIAVKDIPKAGALPGEILIKVMRCFICGSDLTIFHGKHPWAIRPLVMGHEFSGVVEAHGKGVKKPKIGTRVAVIPHRVCGKCPACKKKVYNFCESLRCMGAEAHGAYAEYISVPAEMVVPISKNMSFEDAALLEPACVALHAVKRVGSLKGKNVLVVGAGPIGAFAVQAAKALGAKKVFIADTDEWRLNLVKKFKVTAALNIKKTKLENALKRIGTSIKEIDVFFDCVGMEGVVLDEILRLARRGTDIVMVGVLRREYNLPHLPEFVQHELTLYGTTMYVPEDFRHMIRLMSEGKVSTKGLKTHEFKLEEIQKVFAFIEARKEPFFKIMLKNN